VRLRGAISVVDSQGVPSTKQVFLVSSRIWLWVKTLMIGPGCSLGLA
jgi:hypothetical protein